MEQFIKDRFNDAILHEAAQRYGVAGAAVTMLDSFESFIFEFSREGTDYILRIGHSHRRNQTLIEGETEWINYLVAGGVSATQAIYSLNNKLVEPIADGHGGQFLAVAFVKAAGGPPRGRWTPELYETYGETIGRMHTLTKAYTGPHKRPEWDDPVFEFVNSFLPEGESAIKQAYRQVCDYVRTLPKDSQSYGLTHQDAHGSNLFVDDAGRITLFDFDDCGYNWLVNDIAMVLFYMASTQEDKAAFTAEFMPHFLRGYTRVCTLQPQWLLEIPHFMKIREIELYAVIHRDFDVDNIDDGWIANFMRGRKERIETGQPYIELDFSTLEPLLNSPTV
ncbi:MAG: phosphotransferase [Anaerolineales bacterium]|nr:phosphotransferase [Anaerolineales bacterium]